MEKSWYRGVWHYVASLPGGVSLWDLVESVGARAQVLAKRRILLLVDSGWDYLGCLVVLLICDVPSAVFIIRYEILVYQ